MRQWSLQKTRARSRVSWPKASPKGFELTITALKCGHSILTTSGNVSEHSTGDAVDIADIDGVPVTGHQGPGTMTDELIRDVLALQGTMHPHQVISLEDLPGETSFALPDHYDHVHVGYHPLSGPFDQQFNALLKPDQWQRLTHRLGEEALGVSGRDLRDERAIVRLDAGELRGSDPPRVPEARSDVRQVSAGYDAVPPRHGGHGAHGRSAFGNGSVLYQCGRQRVSQFQITQSQGLGLLCIREGYRRYRGG